MCQATGDDIPISFKTGHSPWDVVALRLESSQIMENLILQPDLVRGLVRNTMDRLSNG